MKNLKVCLGLLTASLCMLKSEGNFFNLQAHLQDSHPNMLVVYELIEVKLGAGHLYLKYKNLGTNAIVNKIHKETDAYTGEYKEWTPLTLEKLNAKFREITIISKDKVTFERDREFWPTESLKQ